MITAIWAQDKNGLIGNNGDLPWHNPDDLKMFKELTLGKTIVKCCLNIKDFRR